MFRQYIVVVPVFYNAVYEMKLQTTKRYISIIAVGIYSVVLIVNVHTETGS